MPVQSMDYRVNPNDTDADTDRNFAIEIVRSNAIHLPSTTRHAPGALPHRGAASGQRTDVSDQLGHGAAATMEDHFADGGS